MKQKLMLSVIVVMALSLGLWKWSSAQFETSKVFNVTNYYEATPVVEEPAFNLGALSSGDYLPAQLCQSDDCTFSAVGSFIDASTTIVSVPTPFLKVTSTVGDVVLRDNGNGTGFTGATTTVELVRLQVDGAATTTYSIGCAQGISAFATSSFSYPIIDTVNTVTGTPYIESGITAGWAETGWVAAASTTIQKILLTPSKPYLVCKVFPAASGAFTNAANTFTGKYLVRFSRIRQ